MKIKKNIKMLVFVLVMSFVTIGQQAVVQAATSHYDAIVDSNYTGESGAKVNGIKTYFSVKAALHDANSVSGGSYIIFIKNGRYYEKINIVRSAITLIGEDKDKTILTYDANAGDLSPQGNMYGTVGCASLTVKAPNFRAENLNIDNGFDYVGNQAKDKDDPTKTQYTQAVALKLEGLSDKAVFRNVKLTGYQDTLFADVGRSYFVDCDIYGNIDFIFGSGQAVFNHDNIISIEPGYIAAPSTYANNRYGFLFTNCNLTRGSDKVADNSVALGRPWHACGSVNSEVAYVNCAMDSHIELEGWSTMSKDKPEENRMYEYGSTGLGAKANDYRTKFILSDDTAENYTSDKVLDGWNPESE